MSINDLKTIGPTLGFSETLDNLRSVKWSVTGTDTLTTGQGFMNNKPSIPTAATGGGFNQQISIQAAQNIGAANSSIQHKTGRYADVTAGGACNNVFGKILNATQLAA